MILFMRDNQRVIEIIWIFIKISMTIMKLLKLKGKKKRGIIEV